MKDAINTVGGVRNTIVLLLVLAMVAGMQAVTLYLVSQRVTELVTWVQAEVQTYADLPEQVAELAAQVEEGC